MRQQDTETERMSERELIEQLVRDLNQAHDELMKAQGVADPSALDWPEWSPQANSIREAEKVLGKRLAKTEAWTTHLATKPDFYSFRPAGQSQDENNAAIQDAISGLRDQGATWVRMTAVNDRHQRLEEGQPPFGFWVEGWRVQPRDEGSFDPPLTCAQAAEV